MRRQILTASVILVPGLTVAAADEPQSTAASADQLTEIVVTATKRTENVRAIPASITAISGEEIEQRGIQGIEDLTKLTPGVNYTQPADGALRITMRGISADPNTNPTTGILFEDVSFTDAYLPRVTLDPNPFDLANVEVLKGPQGTLFGAESLNGAVRYEPEQPKLDQWEFKYFAQYLGHGGGANGQSAGGAINIPLNSDTALRITGLERRDPGYVDNLITHQRNINSIDQNAVRAILSFQPGDSFQSKVTYAWQETNLNDLPTTDNRDGNLSAANRPRSSPAEQAYQFVLLDNRYVFEPMTLVSETSYISKNFADYVDASSRANLPPPAPQPAVEAHPDSGHSRTLAQELRLVSNVDPNWKWVTGIYGSRETIDYNLRDIWGDPNTSPLVSAAVQNPNYAPIPLGTLWLLDAQPDVLGLRTNVTVKELAAFFDVTRRLGSDWDVELGGRLYDISSSGTSIKTGLLIGLEGFPNALQEINADLVQRGFNPKASVTWRATDSVMSYATVSKGSRVGGVQPYFTSPGATLPAPDTFKSDTIWNYEMGLRTQWLDNTLHADFSAFLERWKDPQVFVLPPGQLIPYLDNVGGVRSKGGDATIEYLTPVRGLSLRVAGAYTDAYTTASLLLSNGAIAPAGAAWPAAPKWQTSASIAYETNLGSWRVGGSVTHNFISQAIYALAQPEAIYGYRTVDAQLELTSLTHSWLPRLSLIGGNLGNTRGITNAFGGTHYNDVTYIAPRSIMLRLSGKL